MCELTSSASERTGCIKSFFVVQSHKALLAQKACQQVLFFGQFLLSFSRIVMTRLR